ncbi:hypothetical protein CA13_39550 [Planctomycetes bacterium CA13]|uniref:Uncharacterized protein n=1 Tax=Novipirellula herctigrandis TaxID=2527986 RepID=A0A5C5Z591_9BACT|nr:hypothetical protein CA13_39550 [Planctomycetes bacterium CA13]
MDGTTESIIAVIGHPIAGNPTQFALERVFDSLHLDWRVLSFDVKPENLATALLGLEVLGVQGVLLDTALTKHTATQHAAPVSDENTSDEPNLVKFDCFYRNEKIRVGLIGYDAQSDWIRRQIETHYRSANESLSRSVCVIGQFHLDEQRVLPKEFSESVAFLLREDGEKFEEDVIRDAGIILLGEHNAALEWDDWLLSNSSVLVVDMTDGYPLLPKLVESGRTVITCDQRQVGALCHCIEQWIGETPSPEIIIDAIEEYMAV